MSSVLFSATLFPETEFCFYYIKNRISHLFFVCDTNIVVVLLTQLTSEVKAVLSFNCHF